MSNAIRVTTDASGEATSETHLYGTGVVSSNDYKASGVTVRSGLHNRTVSSADQVADSDIVVVDGMEVTAKMARELGLMGKVFDDGLSVGAAARAAQEHGYKPENGNDEVAKTGHDDYDQTVAALNSQIEAGTMKMEEAMNYDTAHGELALAGLTADQATETFDGLANGTISELDLDSNTRAVITGVAAKVTAASTASAKAELGQAVFDRLAQVARSNPEVDDALRSYAIMRAQGRADVSWAEFLQDVEDHVRGVR